MNELTTKFNEVLDALREDKENGIEKSIIDWETELGNESVN